jgi:hypothetical protein
MHWIQIWPDIQANLKAGHQISGEAGYRKSGRILGSKFKCLLKYEINKKTDVTKVPFFKLA